MTAGTRPPVIGIAGGIGSGKSTVARILGELGCCVSDSDAAAREVLDRPEVIAAVTDRFGEGVLSAGRIDRRRLGSIVFEDAAARAWLEGLTHPLIHEHRERLFDACAGDVRALVIDAPLLFETGLDARCDAVVFVEASREARLGRVAGSRGWDEAELNRREKAQLPLDDKRRRSDYHVTNEGDERELAAQLTRILDRLNERSRSRRSGMA